MSDQEVFTIEPPPLQPNGFVRFCAGVGHGILRVVAGNFQKIHPTDAESAALSFSATPITEPVGQSYAVWRRSALWIASIAMFIYAVVLFATFESAESKVRKGFRTIAEQTLEKEKELARRDPRVAAFRANAPSDSRRIKTAEDYYIKQIKKDNLRIVDTVFLVGHSVVLLSVVLIVLSAVFWTHVRLSRLLSRIGWGIVIATPILLGLLPLSKMMDFSHLGDKLVQTSIVKSFGVAFAILIFAQEGAKVLAIFPGIIRSSMGLKTLLPESATPGWIVALVAPIYAMLVLLFVITANQMQGNWMLIVGAFCLMLAPLVYIAFGKAIVRPHSANEISSVIVPIKLGVVVLNLIGTVLLSIWFVDLPGVGAREVFKFLFGIIANVLLLTVVVTDIVIQTMRLGYIQSRGFHQSRMREMLDRRFAALAQIGRTEKEPESDVAPPPMPGEAISEPPRINDNSQVAETARIEPPRE